MANRPPDPAEPNAPDDEPDLDADSVVELALEDVLDLHGFPPRDVKEIVLGYLDAALAAGFAAVRIVHGKGIGVQREAVRTLLAADPRVTEYGDAPEHHGGKGATVVRFRGARPPD